MSGINRLDLEFLLAQERLLADIKDYELINNQESLIWITYLNNNLL
jgi:hypothetical protein